LRPRGRRCRRPGDLDLALHADIPQRHVAQQLPVLLNRVAIVSRAVADGPGRWRRISRSRSLGRVRAGFEVRPHTRPR
jgi:hypothetical protein